MNLGVDGVGMGPYTPLIDGGAACERVAGFDASGFRFGGQAPGRVCRVCRRLPGSALCALLWTFRVSFVSPRCLTLASEERETWTAGSLRLGFGRALHSDVRRENCSDGHVSRFIAFWSVLSGMWIETDVFGTRRDDRAEARSEL